MCLVDLSYVCVARYSLTYTPTLQRSLRSSATIEMVWVLRLSSEKAHTVAKQIAFIARAVGCMS